MNFFKISLLIQNWENKPEKAPPVLFEIYFSFTNSNFKITTKIKIDLFSFIEYIKKKEIFKMFNILVLHLETLQAVYKLDQSYKYLTTVGQHPVTGECFFLFHQITPLCWELQFLPYNKFFHKFSFFYDNFVSIRFRFDDEESRVYLFQELKTGELIPDFYDMFKHKYKEGLDYTELILRISKLNCDEFLELCEYFISFTMTRTNLKLCKTYVSLISWKIERKS
jgi:hypothetical protein